MPSPPLKKVRLYSPEPGYLSTAPPVVAAQLPPKKPRTHPKKSALQRRADKQRKTFPEPCSAEDVLWQDVKGLLGEDVVRDMIEKRNEFEAPVGFDERINGERREILVQIERLGSEGEGLGWLVEGDEVNKLWVFVVPFSLPGERVKARVFRNERLHSHADFLGIVSPAAESMRNNSLVRCKYFNTCGGCQYQMLPYETQLSLKRIVIVKAFANFFPAHLTHPEILPTEASPLQYDYRTKLTPHFNKAKEGRPAIGFNAKGTRNKVVDIEDCPIATPEINAALPVLRQQIYDGLDANKYPKGATLLLRNTLNNPPSGVVTSHNATVTEKVDDVLFEYHASAFFQNNNSVLPVLTAYIRHAIKSANLRYLIDTYCGSGLFALTLADAFESVVGVEISKEGVQSARTNLEKNLQLKKSIEFTLGDATAIFAAIPATYDPRATAVIMDPPRKGSTTAFLHQLWEWGPQVIVYVSCNVHTQVRDLGVFLDLGKYKIESVRGFDLFPQTAHVESVVVLRKISVD